MKGRHVTLRHLSPKTLGYSIQDIMVTTAEFDACFNGAWIQITFMNFLVAGLILVKGSIKWLFLRAVIDIALQVPVINMCLQNSPYSIEVMWKTFDYAKFFFFPLTAVYTVIIIPTRSRVGAYKKHMILGNTLSGASSGLQAHLSNHNARWETGVIWLGPKRREC
ncbi:hypothetical protein BC832DRAFT_144721 [Gaertneriomyces semiglobifer]|nr:hypothetical protein BC832DRAFT_144721 [Gaertneriomyces semiglobifer]